VMRSFFAQMSFLPWGVETMSSTPSSVRLDHETVEDSKRL
jgi:hypothetical protein